MSASRRAIGWRVLVILTIVIVAQLALTSAVSADGGTCVIVVQRGDTLSSIARRFCTTANAIAQLNCICNPNRIFAGQRLIVPCCCQTSCPSTCQPTCQMACPPACQPACAVVCPPACQTICPTCCTHIVRPGETLSSIAAMFCTSVSALMRLNGICNPNLIFVGQCLRVC